MVFFLRGGERGLGLVLISDGTGTVRSTAFELFSPEFVQASESLESQIRQVLFACAIILLVLVMCGCV